MVIDKALNPDPKRKPEKTIKFASDIDKIKFDVEADIVDQLREAFEKSQKDEQCLQVIAPTQEGVKALVLMEKKSYQLALMRALATTDDPKLLQWMVEHQEGIDPMANRLMYKYYKALEKKEKSGILDALKRRNQK